MNEQANPTTETIPNETTQQEVNQNPNAEQTTPETSGSTSGQEESQQVDTFSQMYDMLIERDETIKRQTAEIAALKKQNTEMLLKVNASGSSGGTKSPYEKFVDTMVKRR